VGLLFYTNRILNPALVLIEVFINLYVLFINGERSGSMEEVYPILVGLLPGVRQQLLSLLDSSGLLKFATYAFLLPLILFQAAGVRRPIRCGKAVWLSFRCGTWLPCIPSRPYAARPWRCCFNNQGLVAGVRAGLGLIRVADRP